MLAFLYCDRRSPEKTSIWWADTASDAIGSICKILHVPALWVEMERVPDLDGKDTCPEDVLDEHRVRMMDRFPVQKTADVPDDDQYVLPPVRRAREMEIEVPDGGDLPKWEKVAKPRKAHTEVGPKIKLKTKPKVVYHDGDRDEWGNLL